MREVTIADGYTYKDGNPYEGTVQTTLAGNIPKTPIHSVMSRFEVSKHSGTHVLRIGLTESYHNVKDFSTNRSVFFQEVAAQPRQLLSPTTDADGYSGFNSAAEYHNGFENKLTAYASDNWELSDKLSVNYGVNLRYHKLKGDYYAQPRTPGFTFVGLEKSNFDYDWMHLGATANLVYKATDNFGLTADVIYTEKHGQLEDFSGGYNPDYTKTRSPYASAGVYFNSPKISIVSALTYLTRNNYIQRLNLVNPADATQSNVSYQQYGIKTTGWTTDIVAKPLKGFSVHYLITFQNPVYQNYEVNAFNNQYSFSGSNVLGVSKVLMEIDPSYSFNKWKIWGSARFFSKQYANLTNALYFKGWWETFAGVNFQAKKNIGVGLTVVNILNQNGAKGTINGAELITDPSLYYNRVLTSAFIRPFTVEGSMNFKF
ncbi:MAG: TonB-dependent receptor [Pedobacter sp.]|nr:MAG: TonB-dependent receptor [Pedobacter sp.]